MRLISHRTQRALESALVNAALLLVCFVAIMPILTTLLISFKNQADITRKPPILFPCDSPARAFDWTACR
jgi:ABC-type glycerol-3-phosphate transport system permease component